MASMESELPTKIYGDIKNLHKELEELALRTKSTPSEWGQNTCTSGDAIIIKGK